MTTPRGTDPLDTRIVGFPFRSKRRDLDRGTTYPIQS